MLEALLPLEVNVQIHLSLCSDIKRRVEGVQKAVGLNWTQHSVCLPVLMPITECSSCFRTFKPVRIRVFHLHMTVLHTQSTGKTNTIFMAIYDLV